MGFLSALVCASKCIDHIKCAVSRQGLSTARFEPRRMLKNYSNRQDQHDDAYEHDVYDLCVVYMATKQKPECTCFQFGIKRSETWHMTIEQRTIETGT